MLQGSIASSFLRVSGRNIFITSEQWVKLLDFGLALPQLPIADPADSTMRLVTQRGAVVGSSNPRPPE